MYLKKKSDDITYNDLQTVFIKRVLKNIIINFITHSYTLVENAYLGVCKTYYNHFKNYNLYTLKRVII